VAPDCGTDRLSTAATKSTKNVAKFEHLGADTTTNPNYNSGRHKIEKEELSVLASSHSFMSHPLLSTKPEIRIKYTKL
jgi:hypothetical protein